ncbi:MAG: hypothetical protein IT215_02185, partial [Chitinophagaceae bacterium]|nr:hypothetical protein [Chitinophagaceae bacterium]
IKKYPGSLEIIKGVHAFTNKKSTAISGIKIIDSKKFSITLNNSFVNLPEILSDLTLSIVPTTFEKNIKNGMYIGSGPYKLTSNTPEKIELDFFENYYEKNIKIKKINFLVLKTESEFSKLQKNDEIDHSHPFDINLSTDKNWIDYSFLNASVHFMSFNPDKNEVKDLETRKLLISLLDIEEIQKNLSPDQHYPISHFIPLGLPGYIPEKWANPYSKEYSAQKIKSIRFDTPIIITNYLPDEKYKTISNTICNTWKKYGIACETKFVDLDQAIKIIRRKNHQVLIGKFIPDIPDTSQVLSFFRTDNHIPVFNINDLKVDEMLSRAMKNPSGQMRTDYYRVINRLIFEHYSVIPLQYGGRKTHFIKSKFIMPELDVTGPYFLRMKNISTKKPN